MKNKIINGDCLEAMKDIEDCSVDAIITDPPYGTTACKWDSVIPFEVMWGQLNRVIKKITNISRLFQRNVIVNISGAVYPCFRPLF